MSLRCESLDPHQDILQIETNVFGVAQSMSTRYRIYSIVSRLHSGGPDGLGRRSANAVFFLHSTPDMRLSSTIMRSAGIKESSAFSQVSDLGTAGLVIVIFIADSVSIYHVPLSLDEVKKSRNNSATSGETRQDLTTCSLQPTYLLRWQPLGIPMLSNCHKILG